MTETEKPCWKTCKRDKCPDFFSCEMHWGPLDTSDEHEDDWSTK